MQRLTAARDVFVTQADAAGVHFSALARPRSPPVPIGRRKPALVEGPATSSSRPHTARVSRLSGTKVAGKNNIPAPLSLKRAHGCRLVAFA